jgi:5-methylcytosine-specific restriction endonuclease McrA
VRRFERADAPAFWGEREAAWRASDPRSTGKEALRNRKHERRPLAAWFHDLVRPAGEPRNCAYCDGRLGGTSPETIDHFVPEARDPTLGLAWANLYPACAACNTSHKGERWDDALLRPEAFRAEQVVVDMETGELLPAEDLDPQTVARLTVTFTLLGLNERPRPDLRRRAFREVLAARRAGDFELLEAQVRQGPYRFIAASVLRVLRPTENGFP